MIARGMQRINYGPQSFEQNQTILFNKLIISWPPPGSQVPSITYSGGTFYIPNFSRSDYLITWSFSIKAGTVLYDMKYNCLFDMDYKGGGFITEGCSGSLITTTGLLKGYKVLHVLTKTSTDLLTFSIKDTSYINTTTLSTPAHPLPNGIHINEIANASISIISI